MKKSLNRKRFGFQKAIFCVGFVISMLMFSVTASAQERLYTSTTDSASEESYEYFEGKVISGVNVRQEAGPDKEKVMVDGKGVVLTKGTMVTIIDTTKVGSKPWYKLQFTYKGQELEGYATSSFIKKTGGVITPTPMPVPTSEPAAEPTAIPEPTKVLEVVATPVPTAVPVQETQNEEESNLPVFLIVAIVVIAAAGGGLYFYLVKRNKMGETAHVSEKVDRLKNILLTSKDENAATMKVNTSSQTEKKKPDVSILKADKAVRHADSIPKKSEVYVLKAKEEPMEVHLELTATNEVIHLEDESMDVPEHNHMQQENADKKALRIAVSNLKEHDIILHKFFGKGEVYDNSDVRLIEIRFGNDVRFMNKEQLVNKKLIQITNEKKR